jgi:hypothetical protein
MHTEIWRENLLKRNTFGLKQNMEENIQALLRQTRGLNWLRIIFRISGVEYLSSVTNT